MQGFGSGSVDAWAAMQDKLKDCELRLLSLARSDLERTEALRTATRLLRSALELVVENGDPSRPRLTTLLDPTRKILIDNPYSTYLWAPLDARYRYRLFGWRGTSTYLGLTTYCGGGTDGGWPAAIGDAVNDTGLHVDADGMVDLSLSATRPDHGDWLRLEADVDCLIVRQYFSHVGTETPAALSIERLDAAPLPDDLNDQVLEARIGAGLRFLDTQTALIEEFHEGMRTVESNTFRSPFKRPVNPPGRASGYVYPTLDNRYYLGHYEVDPGRALVVRLQPPRCRYWSFYLWSPWLESHPYGGFGGIITRENAVAEPNGEVRIVCSDTNPGVPNWLSTAHRPRGGMASRWLLPEERTPRPQCMVVPINEVADMR